MLEGSVLDNLRYPFRLKSHALRRPTESSWRDWLVEFGRESSFLHRRSDELSGGEAQIVALMRVLQLHPEILLLDEPTSAMDPRAAAAAENLIVRWCEEQNGAFLWISHDEEQANRVASRQLRLQDGHLDEGIRS